MSRPSFPTLLQPPPTPSFLPTPLRRVLKQQMFTLQLLTFIFLLHSIDLVIVLMNFMTPDRKAKTLIPPAFSPSNPPALLEFPFSHILCRLANLVGPASSPDWLIQWTTWDGIGHNGNWNAPLQPTSISSRTPCPAINAMATHNILPHDGRRITPHQLAAATSRTYNLSPTLAIQLVSPLHPLWQGKGYFDLQDICAHGIIEHDASLLRPDCNSPQQAADPLAQSHVDLNLNDQFLPASFQKIDHAWISTSLTRRRIECYMQNGQYNLPFSSKFFGSGNGALMHAIFDGKVSDLRQWCGSDAGPNDTSPGSQTMGYERMPAGIWHPSTREGWGKSIASAMRATIQIELGTGWTDVNRAEVSKKLKSV